MRRRTLLASSGLLGVGLACGGGGGPSGPLDADVAPVPAPVPDPEPAPAFGPVEASVAWLATDPDGRCNLHVAPLADPLTTRSVAMPPPRGATERGPCPDVATVAVAVPDHAARSAWLGGASRADTHEPVLLAGDGLAVEVDLRSMQARTVPPAPDGASIEALGYSAEGWVLAWASLPAEQRGEDDEASLCLGETCFSANDSWAAELVLAGLYVETDDVFLPQAGPEVVYVGEGESPPFSLGMTTRPPGATLPRPLLARHDVDHGELVLVEPPPAGLDALDPKVGGATWHLWKGPRNVAILHLAGEPGEPPVTPLALEGPGGWQPLPGFPPGEFVSFDLRGYYLLACTRTIGQVFDLRTGEAIWDAPDACPFFWDVSYG